MDLISFLRSTNSRVSMDNKWLVYDDGSEEWIVYEHRYGKRTNTVLYRGASLDKAVDALMWEG